MAEKGLTIPQMKAISGHHSDTVLQQYIDNSDKLKSIGENALAIGTDYTASTTPIRKTAVLDKIAPSEFTTPPAPAINKNIINVKLFNSTVNGNIVIQIGGTTSNDK
jgi:hypothetical protein